MTEGIERQNQKKKKKKLNYFGKRKFTDTWEYWKRIHVKRGDERKKKKCIFGESGNC